jgi:hypothetical protein
MALCELDRISLAERHVKRGREIVARQRELIAQLRAHRCDTAFAEDLLQCFERSLAIFEDDLARLSNRSVGNHHRADGA